MLDDFRVSFPDLKRWAEDRKERRRRGVSLLNLGPAS